VANYKILERTILPIDSATLKYRDLWVEKSDKLVFIDPEFWTCHTFKILMENCIYDTRGNEIINTTINHGCTIEDLYNRDAHGLNWYRGALRKIYGPPLKTLTPGLTISEVADALDSYGW